MLDPGSLPLLLAAVGLVALSEIALFWAAASLADLPEMSRIRSLAVPLGVTAACAGLIAGVAWYLGVASAPLAPDHRSSALLAGAIAVALTWVVPAALYAPLLTVSVSRSMFVAVLQLLLRAFLYVLLAAAVLLVLALLQISSGTDVRAALDLPGGTALLRLP